MVVAPRVYAAVEGSTALAKRVLACLDVRSNDAGDLVVTKGDQVGLPVGMKPLDKCSCLFAHCIIIYSLHHRAVRLYFWAHICLVCAV